MKMKKILSASMAMALAFCMLVQLLPVFQWSPATAQAASYTKTLSFIDKTSTIKPGASYVTSATMDVYGWQLDTEKTTSTLLSRLQTNDGDIHRLDGGGLVARLLMSTESAPEELVIAFDVEKSGIYNTEGVFTTLSHYCAPNINFKVDGVLVAVENTNTGSGNTVTSQWQQVALAKGRHYLTISNPGADGTQWNRIYLQQVKFDLVAESDVLSFGSKDESRVKISSATMEDYSWQLNTDKTSAGLISRIEAETGLSDHHLDSGYLRARVLDGEKLAIDFDLTSAGVYDIKSVFVTDGHYCAPNMQVCIDGLNIANENTKVGDIGSFATKSASWGKFYLTSGRHTMEITNPGADVDGYNYVQLKNMSFAKCYQAKPVNLDFKASGESTELITQATLAGYGWEIDQTASHPNVPYRGSNSGYSQFFHLSPSGYMLVNLTDGEYMAIRFNVEAEGDYAVNATFKDGAADCFDDLSVHIDSMSNQPIATENLTDGASGWVTKNWGTVHLTKGEHLIYFANPAGGTLTTFGQNAGIYLKSLSFATATKAQAKTVEFKTTQAGADTMIPSATLDANGWEMDASKCDDDVNYRASQGGYMTHYRLDKTDYLTAVLLNDDRLAIKFNLAAEGEYDITANMLMGGQLANNLTVQMGSADSAAIANIDCTAGSGAYENVSLGKAILSAGENTIIFTNPGGSEFDTQRIYIKSLTFTPKNAVTSRVEYFTDTTALAAYTDTITVGEIPLKDADGNAVVLTDANVKTSVDDESVVEFGASMSADGKLMYMAKGLKDGSANANVTVEKLNSDGSYSMADFTVALTVTAAPVEPEEPEIEKFVLAGSNMELGNTLVMNFAINKTDLEGEDYYAVVKLYDTKNGTIEKTIPYSEWDIRSNLAIVPMPMVARQMADKITAEIFDSEGNAVSELWEDSVRNYVMRTLEKQNAKTKRVMVDMLNYGAAAQVNFEYNTGDLANNQLSAEQQAYGTATASPESKLVKGANYYGSTLSLTSNLVLTLVFNNIENREYAMITYTNHRGVEVSERVEKADFYDYGSGGIYGIRINTLLVADGDQLVEVNVYDAEGNVIASGSDSMDGYAARNLEKAAINEAIAKFTESAYAYFHA